MAAARAKALVPGLVMVGSGYTYLQEYVAHAAQAAVRTGMIDIVALDRMVLSYPELPADALAGKTLTRNRICRTFSDCTTAPATDSAAAATAWQLWNPAEWITMSVIQGDACHP